MLRWLGGFTAIVILLVLGCGVLIFDSTPQVTTPAAPDYDTVAAGKRVLQRSQDDLRAADPEAWLSFSQQDLQQLASMASYTLEWADAELQLSDGELRLLASVRMPDNPFGGYLNIRASIPSSDQYLVLDDVRVGALPLPGNLLLATVAWSMDKLLGDGSGSRWLASINRVAVENKMLRMQVAPPGDIRQQLKRSLRVVQAFRLPDSERQGARAYYDTLVATVGERRREQFSLVELMQPLIVLAAQRSAGGDPVAENRALVWGLAIYLSRGQSENLLGDLVSSQRPLVIPPYLVTLAGRRDLMQHFVYSALITLASEQGIGIAAGEFKELLDAGAGGSGFSFADLAADRAGVRFAQMASLNTTSARRLQQRLLAHPGEQAFFPDIRQLVEGLGNIAFTQDYDSLGSQRYAAEIALIDSRLDALPLYR